MAEPLPETTLAWLRQTAKFDGAVTAQVLLHLLERVEALEQKYETQRLATLEWGKDVDKLMRWIDDHLKRIMALEAAQQQQPHQDKLDRLIAHDAPAPEAAPVATDKEQPLPPHIAITYQPKSVYQPLRPAQPPAAQPDPVAAPAGGLVERVAKAIHPRICADPNLYRHEARAAIREVAAWIRSDLNGRSVADRLEQEAGQ